MFLLERNTDNRGRPCDFCRNWKRSRSRRRFRRSCFALIVLPVPRCRSLLLAFLAPDLLVRIARALALVRLGWAEGTDLRRDLPDQALVHALDLDRGRALAGDLDAFGHRI